MTRGDFFLPPSVLILIHPTKGMTDSPNFSAVTNVTSPAQPAQSLSANCFKCHPAHSPGEGSATNV